MTNYQIIALLFPLGVAAACGLFGLGLVKWLNRKYPRAPAEVIIDTDQATQTFRADPDEATAVARHLVEVVRRDLVKSL